MATCHWEHACYTAECIAGLTLTMFRDEAHAGYTPERVERGAACPESNTDIAAEILRLADNVATGLFHGHGHDAPMDTIGARDATDAIDRVLETNTASPFLAACA